MGEIVIKNFRNAAEAVISNNKELTDLVFETEPMVDSLDKLLTEYMVKIDNMSLTPTQHVLVKNLFYTIHDLERIGDHCENIAELARTKIEEDLRFSMIAMEELKDITERVGTALESAVRARSEMDLEAAQKAADIEDQVDELENYLRERHILRLSNRECLPESGILFLDTISNLERISDHSLNIAEYVQSEL